jgi:hypothetical protein
MNANLADGRGSMHNIEERVPGVILPHSYALDEVLGLLTR